MLLIIKTTENRINVDGIVDLDGIREHFQLVEEALRSLSAE